MQVWNVLHVARWKYRLQKIAKNSPSGHHRTNLSGCIFVTKACIDNQNKVLSSNISSTCPQNMADSGPLTAEIGSGVWGTPASFNGFRQLARYCHDVTHRRPTELCTMFGHLLGWYTIYIFGGSCPQTEFCQVQNSRYVEVLHSPTLAALLHRTPAAGVRETLRHGAGNGITELRRGRNR